MFLRRRPSVWSCFECNIGGAFRGALQWSDILQLRAASREGTESTLQHVIFELVRIIGPGRDSEKVSAAFLEDDTMDIDVQVEDATLQSVRQKLESLRQPLLPGPDSVVPARRYGGKLPREVFAALGFGKILVNATAKLQQTGVPGSHACFKLAVDSSLQVLKDISVHDVNLVQRITVVILAEIAKADQGCVTGAQEELINRLSEDHRTSDFARMVSASALLSSATAAPILGEALLTSLCVRSSRRVRKHFGMCLVKMYDTFTTDAAALHATAWASKLVSAFSHGGKHSRKRVMRALMRLHKLEILEKLPYGPVHSLVSSALSDDCGYVRSLARDVSAKLGIMVNWKPLLVKFAKKLAESSQSLVKECTESHVEGPSLESSLEKLSTAKTGIDTVRQFVARPRDIVASPSRSPLAIEDSDVSTSRCWSDSARCWSDSE